MSKLSIDLNEMWPVIEEVISSGGEFQLFPRGTSMMPLLREGIDSVILASPNNLKNGDIVLYVRKNGQFVLHRIVKIKNDCYIMCGDNQYKLEYGIKKENILAKVVSLFRESVTVTLDNKKYKNYVRSLPGIRFRKKVRAFLSFVKHRIIK